MRDEKFFFSKVWSRDDVLELAMYKYMRKSLALVAEIWRDECAKSSGRGCKRSGGGGWLEEKWRRRLGGSEVEEKVGWKRSGGGGRKVEEEVGWVC